MQPILVGVGDKGIARDPVKRIFQKHENFAVKRFRSCERLMLFREHYAYASTTPGGESASITEHAVCIHCTNVENTVQRIHRSAYFIRPPHPGING